MAKKTKKATKKQWCGCGIVRLKSGTQALRCSEATAWRFLSKDQAATLKKQHGASKFCTSLKIATLKPRKGGKKRGKGRGKRK